MLKNHILIAWRMVSRNRWYTLIKVLGLALGLCGCIIIWLVGRFELNFDRLHPDKDRIYRVTSKMIRFGINEPEVHPAMPAALRTEVSGLEAVTGFYHYDAKVTIPFGDKAAHHFETEQEATGMSGAAIVDKDWFTIFPYKWLAGNAATSVAQPFTVVLTASRARTYFGALPWKDIIGKQLIYDDSLQVSVSGIVMDWNENTDFPYTDLISFPTIQASFLKQRRPLDYWGNQHGYIAWPTAIVKLSKGVSPATVLPQMDSLIARYVKTDPNNSFRMQLQPLADIHFNGDYHDGRRKAHLPTLYLLMGIALFILLLATVNFINLSTAQSFQRSKEVGVRKVLGSGSGNLVRQFLTETGLIASAAVFLASVMVNPVMSLFQDYVPYGVQFHPWDPRTLLFLVSIAVFTTLLAGLYPARVLASHLPVWTLKGAGVQKGGEKWWLRKSLIVFQFTISLVFIIATMVISNQIRFMLDTDYGFKTDAVLTVSTNMRDTTDRIAVLQEKIRQLPNVAGIVREGSPPIGWWQFNGIITSKGKEVREQRVMMNWGDEHIIPFYQMRLVAGRNLRHTDSLSEWVINETLARNLGFSSPSEAVGKSLYSQNRSFPIVGVVADFHMSSFRDPISPLVIGHSPDMERSLGIKLASAGRQPSDIKAILGKVGNIFRELYPKDEFEFRFMDESIASLYDDEQKTASLARIAMILAISISCMGIFGLSLFTAQRKRKEIGIRKVLGASVADIVRLLNRNFVVLILLSLLIAAPIAWWLMDVWLRDFAYRVPIHWWIFVMAGACAILIAFFSASIQSFRAALENPVEGLRTE